MTPAQLDALIDYIEARAEVCEARMLSEEARNGAENRLLEARNACRDAFTPEPEYRPFNEPLRDPNDP